MTTPTTCKIQRWSDEMICVTCQLRWDIGDPDPRETGSGACNAEQHPLLPWATALMISRAPDFVIGDDYLRRWYIIPRNPYSNVYLHEFRHSDDDRALHDHPWSSTSIVISGSYVEITPEGSFTRKTGDVITRPATAAHRIVIPDGEQVVTLFTTGPWEREWGFHCPQGWRHWKDFTALNDSGQVGRGCAAMDAGAIAAIAIRRDLNSGGAVVSFDVGQP